MDVLLIEDNASISTALSKLLKFKNIHCSPAFTGKSGLELIKTKKWDVILLDLALPDFSGIDVINELNKTDEIKNNKIVILTASNIQKEEIDNLKKMGIYECLTKPVSTNMLLEVLNNASRSS